MWLSQNVADPIDADPKHCLLILKLYQHGLQYISWIFLTTVTGSKESFFLQNTVAYWDCLVMYSREPGLN